MIKFKKDGKFSTYHGCGTVSVTRELERDEYERLKALGNAIEDEFDTATRCGYGLYSCSVYESQGRFFLYYTTGSTCD